MNRNNYSRRNFLKTLGLRIAIVSIFCLSFASAQNSRYPNIIYILADDMGYGDLSCQNPNSKVPTPNINRIAKEGIRFTDAHAGAAVCTPTRYGVMTGRYNWRSRLPNGVLLGYDCPLIETDRLTVPGMLKKYGYQSACIGKWHMGLGWVLKDGRVGAIYEENGEISTSWPDGSVNDSQVDFTKSIEWSPLSFGFDYYFGISASLDMPPYCFIENNQVVELPTVQKPSSMFGRAGLMSPEWKHEDVLPALTEKTMEFIENHVQNQNNEPFFIYMPLNAPHTPIDPSEEFIDKSQAGRYGDFLMEVDWSIGQILAKLDSLNITEETLIIVTSDNGSPGRKQNGAQIYTVKEAYGHDTSGGLRGVKSDIYDGGHRVPFVARWPGMIYPGSISDETICLTDLLATCAAIVGYNLPNDAGEDSYNILPAMLNENLAEPIREATVHQSIHGILSIRQGPWKLILSTGSGGWTLGADSTPGAEGQLYNVDVDRSERKNLWLDFPEIVDHLTLLLESYQTSGRSTPERNKTFSKKENNRKDISTIQNYPNPFNNSTTIEFKVEKTTDIYLRIFDVTGRSVFLKRLNGKTGEKFSEIIKTSTWSSGTYFYSLTSSTGFNLTKKMTLLK